MSWLWSTIINKVPNTINYRERKNEAEGIDIPVNFTLSPMPLQDQQTRSNNRTVTNWTNISIG